MIKLRDFASTLYPKQRVILEDAKTQRVSFDSIADDLLEYSGIDYKRVTETWDKDGTLILKIRNGSY